MSETDENRVLVPEEELRMHRVMRRMRDHITRQGLHAWASAPTAGMAKPGESVRDYAAISGEIIC